MSLAGLVTLFGVTGIISAQELEISVSPSPVGSGARAAGMADAFVAVADDATASSWNPAGLIQLEQPEFALAFAENAIFERFSAPYDPESEVKNRSEALHLNFLSFTYPLPFQLAGRNGVVGLYLQNKYDFGRQFTLPNTNYFFAGEAVVGSMQRMRFEQQGSLNALTAAGAFELTPALALGIGVNLYRNWGIAENGWTQRIDSSVLTKSSDFLEYVRAGQTEKYEEFKGKSFSLGLLWDLSPTWKLGLRYDSPLNANTRYSQSNSRFHTYSSVYGGDPFFAVWDQLEERRAIRFPETWAIGVAKRFTDRDTVSTDISRTDWSDFWYRDGAGKRFSLVNAAPLDDQFQKKPSFDPTYTIRVGFEHLFIPRVADTNLDRLWSLRCGVFFDQEPASGKPDNFYGAALGFGVLMKQWINFDFAYQVRYGSGVNADFIRGIKDFDETVLQHRWVVSTVIYL